MQSLAHSKGAGVTASLAFLSFFKSFPRLALTVQGPDPSPSEMIPPSPPPISSRRSPACSMSCVALLGCGEPLLLAPLGCSGLHGSAGLGSFGWFVKVVLNGHSKPQ